MKNNKVKASKRIENKLRGIGFFEGIRLKTAGRIDGSRNLPRECGNGHWSSPYIDRELHAFYEFSSKIWAHLQIEEEDEYASLGELTDSLTYTKSELQSAEADLAAALVRNEKSDASRRSGESRLTDAQVKARRNHERAKELEPLRNHIDILQNKIVNAVDELSVLRNKIIEDNNSTSMICTKVKNHLLQRLDVYWNAALSKQLENTKMPAVPSIEINSCAETVYMEHHKALMQKAEILIREIYKDEKEAA